MRGLQVRGVDVIRFLLLPFIPSSPLNLVYSEGYFAEEAGSVECLNCLTEKGQEYTSEEGSTECNEWCVRWPPREACVIYDS